MHPGRAKQPLRAPKELSDRLGMRSQCARLRQSWHSVVFLTRVRWKPLEGLCWTVTRSKSYEDHPSSCSENWLQAKCYTSVQVMESLLRALVKQWQCLCGVGVEKLLDSECVFKVEPTRLAHGLDVGLFFLSSKIVHPTDWCVSLPFHLSFILWALLTHCHVSNTVTP